MSLSAHPDTTSAATLADVFAPVPCGRLYGAPRHALLLTAAGTGFATADGRALTRWRGDRLGDGDGAFVYLRDLESGRVWSAAYGPTRARPDAYAVRWDVGAATFEREDDEIATTMRVAVAPAAGGLPPVEVRRVTLANRSGRARRVEVTTYTEPVLQSRAGDLGHPAFSKLFVQTERPGARPVLLAHRRPRGADEAPFWTVHAVADGGPAEAETDRARFVGRGRSVHAPAALATRAPLSGTTGNVLDPVLSLRREVRLAPGETASIDLLWAGADTRDEATAVADALSDAAAVDAAFAAAEAAEAADRAAVGWSDAAEAAHALVAGVVYGAPALRAPADRLRAAAVAPHLAPGETPCSVLVRVATPAGLDAARALAAAVRLWQRKGLPVTFAAWADGVDAATLRDAIGPDGDVPEAASAAACAAARLFADDGLPAPSRDDEIERLTASMPVAPSASLDAAPAVTDECLKLDNGTGGFSPDGTEYVVRVAPQSADGWRLPPMPWSNVVANAHGGFLVTERGAGTTWAANSRLHRLTPWSNDPVADPHGDALYLRDAETGAVWSAAAGPCPARTPYTVRHGWGATVTHHRTDGLDVALTEFLPTDAAVRVSRLELTNTGTTPRRIDAVRYAHLTLGSLADGSDRHVVTEWTDDAGGVLLARNPTAGVFAARVAVAAAVGAPVAGYTACRDAFVGRHRDASCPLALATGAPLGSETGAGLDPCSVLAVSLDIPPGATVTVAFLLGEADSRNAALAAVARLRAPGAVDAALSGVRAFWADLVGAIQIATPEPALDLMVNGWLLYQALSCRIWGRTAFHQSGGAYGYRDQLQDAAALVYARPALFREQILRHAAHQFAEGDVLHWWHPPDAAGIRTRFADDLHWLPYLTAFYVRTTGDTGVLDETAPFLTARALAPGEDEAYLVPEDSGTRGTVYEHAVRALDRGLAVGAHGLPLMGTGDWNDGMNRVGREGRGESVWMGFFLYTILADWAAIADARGDAARAARYRAHRTALADALNADGSGWDGAWFRRAYYDDGTPLGTAAGDECRIDALVQAWGTLSGAATPAHASAALDAMEAHLVDEDAGIIRLLAPAFDRTPHDPGYIKGYLPGVRENGGQYTHAALWAVRALAEAGRCERAAPLLAMLSPVSHTRTPDGVARYQAEPYVVAADVYGVAPHVGRGGWTWYTGSAAWMYRVAVESILGFGVEGGAWITLAPCLPAAWPGATLRYRVPDSGGTVYAVTVDRGDVPGATLDGAPVDATGGRVRVPLVRDGRTHELRLTLSR